MTGDHGVRLRHVVIVAAVVGVLAWAGMRLWLRGGGADAGGSWLTPAVLLVLAVAVWLIGMPVRRFLAGRSRRTLSGLHAARVLVLGQTAALLGGALTGWYAASAVVRVPDADVPSVRAALVRYAVTAGCAAVWSISGLLVQRMCRLPDDDVE